MVNSRMNILILSMSLPVRRVATFSRVAWGVKHVNKTLYGKFELTCVSFGPVTTCAGLSSCEARGWGREGEGGEVAASLRGLVDIPLLNDFPLLVSSEHQRWEKANQCSAMLALLDSRSGARELRGRKQQELESNAFCTTVNIS